ncbi:MAG TPA: enoyl-CoA hydratase-related protein [Chloroflexota bacterium]|nr:enoyl-CoA hydratase-related protein [Chloroflexota bacterium]
MSDYSTIVVDNHDGVTTVRFNRPEKRNAMNPQLHREMYDALSELQFDPETLVLVITGNNESFSAGQDMKEFFLELQDDPRAREEARRFAHSWRDEKLRFFPHPTIAAISGWCLGGGVDVACAADIAIASEDAKFGLPEINHGGFPGGLTTKTFQELVLPRQALFYLMTGRTFDGRTAADIGLITMAVPGDRLQSTVAEIAEELKKKEPNALRTCKEAFKAVLPHVSYDDAYYWIEAKSGHLRSLQKPGRQQESREQFLNKRYKPAAEPLQFEDPEGS